MTAQYNSLANSFAKDQYKYTRSPHCQNSIDTLSRYVLYVFKRIYILIAHYFLLHIRWSWLNGFEMHTEFKTYIICSGTFNSYIAFR